MNAPPDPLLDCLQEKMTGSVLLNPLRFLLNQGERAGYLGVLDGNHSQAAFLDAHRIVVIRGVIPLPESLSLQSKQIANESVREPKHLDRCGGSNASDSGTYSKSSKRSIAQK